MTSHRHPQGQASDVVAAVATQLLQHRAPAAPLPLAEPHGGAATTPLPASLVGAVPAAQPPEVYLVGCGDRDANSRSQASAQSMGFKAWNLLRMAQLALPVPPA